MARKTYKVLHGSHAIPNPDYKPNEENSRSHIDVTEGKTFEIDEARAVAFTTGQNPKLQEVSRTAPEIRAPAVKPAAEVAKAVG